MAATGVTVAMTAAQATAAHAMSFICDLPSIQRQHLFSSTTIKTLFSHFELLKMKQYLCHAFKLFTFLSQRTEADALQSILLPDCRMDQGQKV